MKVALLGVTHPHAGVLQATLELLPEVSAISLWDADPAALTEKSLRGTPKVMLRTTDLTAVLAQPDLVFALLCVPTSQAADLTARVIAAGKHVLAEKPVGLTSAAIAALDAAATRAGLIASVLYPRRLHPCMVAARQWFHGGTLGNLLSVEARFLTTQVRFRDPESWLFRRAEAGGGIVSWLGCHCLDLLHHVTGDEIVAVGAQLAVRSGAAIDVEDTAALTLRFRSGAVGTFHAGYTLAYGGEGYLNQAGYDAYLGFNCDRGRIVWPDLTPRLRVESPPAAGQPAVRDETFPLPASSAYAGAPGEAFIRQFIAAVAGRAQPPTTLADAVRTARIVDAAERSSATGRFIALDVTSAR